MARPHPLRVVDDDEACGEDERAVIVAPASISLQALIHLRRRTGHPVLLADGGQVLGVCGRDGDHRGALRAPRRTGGFMRHVYTTLAFLALTLAGLACPCRPQARRRVPVPSISRAIAARAASRPENTLAGFARALAIGVTTLELDCGVTKDGVVVVSHDRLLSPDHTRDASRPVPGSAGTGDRRPHLRGAPAVRRRPHQARAATYAAAFPEQQPVDGERIPRLADVFALVERSGNRDRALQHRDQDRPGASRADRLGAGLSRAALSRGDPRRRHGVAHDGPVLRLAHAAAAGRARAGDRARRADRPAAGRGHGRGRQARRFGLARRARRGRPRRIGAEARAGARRCDLVAARAGPHARRSWWRRTSLGLAVVPWTVNDPKDMDARYRSAWTASSPTTRIGSAPCWSRRASRCPRRRRCNDRPAPAGAALESAADVVAQALDLGRRGPEPGLRVPPQDVVRGARPFLAHQVVDLEARQAAAELLAHVGA